MLKFLFSPVTHWISNALGAIPAWILGQFVTAGYTRVLIHNPWAQALVLLAQALAGALLGLRVTWEILNHHIIRSQGSPSDVIGTVRNAAVAAFSIFAFPWLSVRLIEFGNDLSTSIVAVLGTQTNNLGSGLGNLVATALGGMAATGGMLAPILAVVAAIILVVCVVLLLLIFIQAMIRTVEAYVAGVIGPVMAIGWVGEGGGTAAAWWRSIIVLAMAQAVQTLLLYTSVAIVTESGVPVYLAPFLLLATLWVTYKTPHMLQEYAYHSGVGGGMASGGSMAANLVLRKLVG